MELCFLLLGFFLLGLLRGTARDHIFTVKPASQIDPLTPLTAKRKIFPLRPPYDLLTTNRTTVYLQIIPPFSF
jgi:hypothetical protein